MQITKKRIALIDNKEVFDISFTNNNNYSVSFFNFGGYLNSILIPYLKNTNLHEDVILGYNNFDEYVSDKIFLNCIVGRVAGRIKDAKFNLNNKTYKLFANDGKNHLHGGKEGFNKKVWKIEKLEKNSTELSCTLSYNASHLEQGYPSNLYCKAHYILNHKNEFNIQFEAESDEDTIINLTNHNYWNFHGHNIHYQNILNHKIKINSDYFCELDKESIPTGNLIKIKEGKYDFKNLKTIDEDVLTKSGIDTYFELKKNENKLNEMALAYSLHTRMGMTLFSNQKGLQFYTGNMMGNYYNGKYNKPYGYQHGFCFEPQVFPNSINQPGFTSSILRAGEKYLSLIIMKLRNDF